MENELLDKEVLCLIDIRQIQKYLFHTNGPMESLGASKVLSVILDDALEYAAKNIDSPLDKSQFDLSYSAEDKQIPYFHNEKVLVQAIVISAGNAFILFRTGRLCQRIIRKVSRYFLDKTHILEISACAVEKTGSFHKDIDAIFNKLDLVKNEFASAHPFLPPAIVKKEKYTGEAVFKILENGEEISKSSFILRQSVAPTDNIVDIKKISPAKGPGGKSYVAIIHMDGNNMGSTIDQVVPKEKNYEESIIIRRTINRNITEGYNDTLKNTVDYIRKKYYPKIFEKVFFRELAFFRQGGDDINLACNPTIAIPFVERFVQELRNICLWKDDKSEVHFSLSAGIAFVYPDSNFFSAFNMAEECCSNAKKFAKKPENSINGLSGTWFDFEFQTDQKIQHLDTTRKRYFRTFENINMQLRPYTLDIQKQDDIRHFDHVKKKIKTLQKIKLGKLKNYLLERSYSIGIIEFENFITKMALDGINLKEMLGDPIIIDSDNERIATWYDAFVLNHFMKEEP